MQAPIRRFKKVKIGLMRSRMFVGLSGVMMLGKTNLTTDVPTAMTDGRNEWYNPEFVFSFDQPEKSCGFIVCHENMHKAARHLSVYRKLHEIDHELANAACDYWINGKLVLADPEETLIALPRKDGKVVGLYDEQYLGKTVMEIFRILQAKAKNGGGGGGGDEETDAGDGDDAGGGGGFDAHDWEAAKEMTQEQAQKLESDVKQAIRQGMMAAKKMDDAAGQGAGQDKLGLKDLVTSKVDWKRQFRDFVQMSCTDKQESSWRKPNRRFLHQGDYLPTLVGESVKEVAFCRDASGSMHHKGRLVKATSEMVAIAKMVRIEKIHLIDWDGEVGFHEEFTADNFTDAPAVMNIHGGGGTDPNCVCKYLKEKGIKPDAVILLTDGEIYDWGTWNAPVLWMITNKEKITAPVGKTINVSEDI